MNGTNLSSALTAGFAPVTNVQAATIARDYFGVSGVAHPLTSERDQNFRIVTDNGSSYLLKITNPAEDRRVTNFQTEALRHIARADPALPVPRILPAADGGLEPLLEFGGEPARVVRLMTFLPGSPLNSLDDVPTGLRRNLGTALARIGTALCDFDHQAAGHELLWDLKQASSLRDLLQHVADAEDRKLANRFQDRFEEHVSPALDRLRTQVVHNDLNFYNVLVDEADVERITGIIDFGDMVRTPLVCDVAVAAAYQLPDTADPLAAALEFISAYHRTVRLEPIEQQLLFDLIATRLLTTVLITGWRARRHPENSAYILRNSPAAWRNLRYFNQLGHDIGTERILAACG